MGVAVCPQTTELFGVSPSAQILRQVLQFGWHSLALQACSEAPARVRHWHRAPAEQGKGKRAREMCRARCEPIGVCEPTGLWHRSCCLCAHVPTHVLGDVWALKMRENSSRLLQLIHHRHLKIQLFRVQKWITPVKNTPLNSRIMAWVHIYMYPLVNSFGAISLFFEEE